MAIDDNDAAFYTVGCDAVGSVAVFADQRTVVTGFTHRIVILDVKVVDALSRKASITLTLAVVAQYLCECQKSNYELRFRICFIANLQVKCLPVPLHSNFVQLVFSTITWIEYYFFFLRFFKMLICNGGYKNNTKKMNYQGIEIDGISIG